MGTACEEESLNDSRTKSRKYLLFQIGSTRFGIPILELTDILELVKCVGEEGRVTNAVTRDGEVVPVVDLRPKLGVSYTQDPDELDHFCVLLVRGENCHGHSVWGLVVEHFAQVLDANSAELGCTLEDSLDASAHSRFLNLGNRAVPLLDPEELLATGEVTEEAGSVFAGHAY
ncbi:MAG: chemotaxis protein CheW [Planctomycetota bacterium]